MTDHETFILKKENTMLRNKLEDIKILINNIQAMALLTISMEPDSDLKKGMETVLKLIEDDSE